MKFINKLVQVVLFLSFLLLVYAFSVVSIFSSNQKLTKVLDDSGFYSASSKLMSEELNKQINSTNTLLNEAIKSSITSTITSDVAKSVIQPAQIVLVDWLNNNKQTVTIDLDLLPIKNKVSAKTTDSQVKFEITRLLPDTFEILASTKNDGGLMSQLIKVKQLYSLAKNYLPYLWIVVGFCVVLLLLLNIAGGSRRLNCVFYPILFSSVLGIFISLGSSFASSNIPLDVDIKTGIDNFQMLSKFVFTILKDTFNIFAITAIASLIGVVLSKAIFRSKDKHLKKKHKK